MKFIFTCGGTAGHINPALAVAGRLRELMPDSKFLFIGVNGKMEMELVPRAGYEIRGLDMTYIVRGHDLHAIMKNLETVRNVARSTREAKKIIRDFGPDAVIGTGGYICYPVLAAAHEEHIPTFVHESNAVPGLTTKLLADRVNRVMLGFEESRQYYRHPERVTVTGTPVRGEFDRVTRETARKELGLKEGDRLVLSVWGSLGAEHMNKIMGELMEKLDGSQGFRLIHAAGSLYYPRLTEEAEGQGAGEMRRGAQGVYPRYAAPHGGGGPDPLPGRGLHHLGAELYGKARRDGALAERDKQPPGEKRPCPRARRRRGGTAGGGVRR